MIDIHTHLWNIETSPDYMRQYLSHKKTVKDLTAEELLKKMDTCGIQKAVVHTLPFHKNMTGQELEKAHRYIFEQVQKSNGRLAGFCAVCLADEDPCERIKKCMEDNGFKGVKIHSNIQEIYPDDTRLYPVYEYLEKRRIPVLFHTGGIGLPGIKDEYGDTGRIDRIACDFPGLPVILGHAGRIHYKRTAELLRKHKYVYADISTNFGRIPGKEYLMLKELMETIKIWCGTTEKLLFGSDHPFYDQDQTLLYVNDLAELYQESEVLELKDVKELMDGNAERFCSEFGIF